MVTREFGHYRILDKIGSGGMGEVFRAHDPHLNRVVAIKVLSGGVTESAERKARFIQEARTASALNHPNIITIHDIGESDGADYIVMEFIGGRTLDRLISRRGLGVSEALRIAIQIVDALAAAHAAGVVHRDLKPTNVIVTDKGLVKVLDFGLAKLTEPQGSSASGTTQVMQPEQPLTEEGSIVGTVSYMSPEQAEGRRVDARSDIFSFGALLYEMLTGRRAFAGETKLATLSAILRAEPEPLRQIMPDIPPEIERVVARCLRKDPERRYQHTEDLKIVLEELKDASDSGQLSSSITTAMRRPRRSLSKPLAAVLATALVILLAGAGWIAMRYFGWPGQSRENASRLRLLLSADGELSQPDLSADGSMMVYVAQDEGRVDLFVSRVRGGGRVRLTNDVTREMRPEFSPDTERVMFSRFVGDWALGEICTVPSLGGPVRVVIRNGFDGAWSPDGKRIVFVRRKPGERDSLATAAADGSDVRVLMEAESTFPWFRHPAWSPDGAQVAVTRTSGGIDASLWLLAADGSAAARRITEDRPGIFSHQAVFMPGGDGVLHHSNRAGAVNLWVQPLRGGEPRRLTFGPGPDLSPSVTTGAVIAFSNSRYRQGLFVYDLQSGASRLLLTHSWFVWAPAFSPDGKTLAFSQAEQDGMWSIWTVPAAGGQPQRLTAGVLSIYPRFSPDGAWVYYHTWTSGPDRIWRVPAGGGAAQPVTPERGDDDQYADVAPDGKRIAFARSEGGTTRVHIAAIDGSNARRLTDGPSTLPRWSPDGQWIAFSPSRSYDQGIFVVRPDGSGLRRVSELGSWPVWWPDGSKVGFEILNSAGDQRILTVPPGGGRPEMLHTVQHSGDNWPFDIAPDGKWLATSNQTQGTAEIWLLEAER